MMTRVVNLAWGFGGMLLCLLAFYGGLRINTEWRQYQAVKQAIADVLCLTPPALQQKYDVRCLVPPGQNGTPSAPVPPAPDRK